LKDELDEIKNRIAFPFDERDENSHFYLIISKDETSIEMLEKYIDYLKNCLKINTGGE